jgi:VWFA-related protein
MRFGWLATLLITALGAVSRGEDFTIRSTVDEVRLTFVATDQHGRNLPSLKADDFAVLDDEMIIRAFRGFGRASETKLDVVVLLDASESVGPQFEREVGDAQQLISSASWAAEDRVSVLTFGGRRTSLICLRNCRDSGAANQLSITRAAGLTPLFDALLSAATLLAQNRDPEFRRVLVVFSDGNDTISMSAAPDALAAAQRADAQIYALDMNKFMTIGSSMLQAMASSTGGRSFPMRDGALKALSSVLQDLRTSYYVTYALPSSAAQIHSVRLLPTRNLQLRFRSRRAYYSEGGARHSKEMQ